MTDPAAFRREDVLAVYSERPHCFLTLHWQWVDASHILGRGYAFGANKTSNERSIFSSIFNFASLHRDIHKGPHRDHPYMRAMLLTIAREKVNEAIAHGRYTANDLDLQFLEHADQWLLTTLRT